MSLWLCPTYNKHLISETNNHCQLRFTAAISASVKNPPGFCNQSRALEKPDFPQVDFTSRTEISLPRICVSGFLISV